MARKVSAKAKSSRAAADLGQTSAGFTVLEKSFLLALGLSRAQLSHLNNRGVRSRDDFKLVGDSTTLSELAGIPIELAEKVMKWALRAVGDAGVLESREYIPWEDLHIRE